jgi:hypothetical protein
LLEPGLRLTRVGLVLACRLATESSSSFMLQKETPQVFNHHR